MMRTLRFEGYGDDTFGEYGLTRDDVDNCASGTPIQCVVDCGEFRKTHGHWTIFKSIV